MAKPPRIRAVSPTATPAPNVSAPKPLRSHGYTEHSHKGNAGRKPIMRHGSTAKP